MAQQEKPLAGENDGLDLMTLADENGREFTLEVLDALDCDGVHYLAAVEYAAPDDDTAHDDQVILLRVGTDDEGEYLDVVDDDEELLKLGKLFEQRLAQRYELSE